jgi:hypothetical protein
MAAVIGGGPKAFNIEVPVLTSWHRGVALGALGTAFIIGSVLLPPPPPPPPTPPPARGGGSGDGYRRHVASTCNAVRRVLARDSLGVPGSDFKYDRDAALHRARANVAAVEERLDLLLAQPVPDTRRSATGVVRRRSDRFITSSRDVVARLRTALPPRFSFEEFLAATAPFQEQLDRDLARLEDAMTQLGGQDCVLSSS